MARPRTFAVDAVIEAAQDTFWAHGYHGAAISDLERATKLRRSSLYGAFGSKEVLFEKALTRYIEVEAVQLFEPLEREGAEADAVATFFGGLARRFRGDTPFAQHGCMWVNSIAETSGRPGFPDALATQFRERLRLAFANALHDSGPSDVVARRSVLLAAATMGVWLAARFDAAAAADWCDLVVAEVSTWPQTRRLQPAPLSIVERWRGERSS